MAYKEGSRDDKMGRNAIVVVFVAALVLCMSVVWKLVH